MDTVYHRMQRLIPSLAIFRVEELGQLITDQVIGNQDINNVEPYVFVPSDSWQIVSRVGGYHIEEASERSLPWYPRKNPETPSPWVMSKTRATLTVSDIHDDSDQDDVELRDSN